VRHKSHAASARIALTGREPQEKMLRAGVPQWGRNPAPKIKIEK
jgi:hypothetical protein